MDLSSWHVMGGGGIVEGPVVVGAGEDVGLVGAWEDVGLEVVGPEEDEPGDQLDDAGGGQVSISARTEASHPLLTK